jgi:FkbM family methyltransferase
MRKIFIDGGCHKGQSIIKARKEFGDNIEIYGFEAVPFLAYSLQEYYKLDSKVNVTWSALWKNNKGINLNFPKKGASWSNSVYERWEEKVTQKVPSIDLSTWLKENVTKKDYVILKLDIEGAEYEVLNKMIKDGTIDLVNEFWGEWHDNKISSLPLNIVNEVKNYFTTKPFNIWEAPWYDESLTPGMTKFPLEIDKNYKWTIVNPFQKITFVIPSRNNLEFLKLAYKSIRNLDTRHDILVLNDASTDGTQEWIDSLNDPDLITHHNPGPERIGIVGMFDKGIEMARTEVIFAFHADMVAAPGLDKHILKYLTRGSVISATRVEPPLHPDGHEKMLVDFGVEVEDFSMDEFNNWVLDEYKPKHGKNVTEGIFAPWCMYKEDFLAIGGHDELFSPQSKEDSDLFNRFVLNGYEVLQTWEGLVYHFTSRGSRFNKHVGGAAGKNSEEWLQTTTTNMKKFIKKWGTPVQHDAFMKPIISPVYKKGVNIINSNPQLQTSLEPWFNGGKDIMVEVDGNNFTQQDFQVIQKLNDIIKDSGEIGQFELGNLQITINSLEEYQNELICVS